MAAGLALPEQVKKVATGLGPREQARRWPQGLCHWSRTGGQPLVMRHRSRFKRLQQDMCCQNRRVTAGLAPPELVKKVATGLGPREQTAIGFVPED